MPVRDILLITIAGGGVFMDVLQEKVDNRLICLGFGTGLFFWIFHSGPGGILDFLSGFLFPLICLLPLHYFGMLGGGDIKLLSVLGGILGYPAVVKLLTSPDTGQKELEKITERKGRGLKITISLFLFLRESSYL